VPPNQTKRIRVGIVGASAKRGFASLAHVPALKALPDYELVAVCTSRQDTADAAARHYGVPLAFGDPHALARHPEVDVVTVSVKASDHFTPVMAAIEAGKHVYCEWPLGRTTDEAVTMLEAARRAGVQHVVGLQGQAAPEIGYVRDLVAQGYVGKVRAATMIGCAPSWGATVESAFQADTASGTSMLTITVGHQLDALCHCLGEFRELSALVVSQRDHIKVTSTGEMVPKNTPDQVVVNGIVDDGVVASFQMRGGPVRGVDFLFEIHGDDGDLVLEAGAPRQSMQRQALKLRGGRSETATLTDLVVPDSYRRVPPAVPAGSPYNVAHLYARLSDAIRTGTRVGPGFGEAVARHRMLDAIVRASQTGRRQPIEAA
jgi:predicted dehydrogenase